MVVKNHYI